jgi:hypothetical protein
MPEFISTLSSLGALGIESVQELGPYIIPSREKLPVIELLEVKQGYICRHCPNLDVALMAAYYSATESTMRKHLQSFHHCDISEYDSCFVQYLYGKQQFKCYFGVETQYVGPTTKSNVTEEGEQLYQEFLQNSTSNVEYFTDPANMSTAILSADTKDIPRLYKELQWLSFVEGTYRAFHGYKKWCHERISIF